MICAKLHTGILFILLFSECLMSICLLLFLYGSYDTKKTIFENVLILTFSCCRKYLLKIC